MRNATSDVIVLGAGAAGLAAAVKLTQTGRRVTILEARDRTGGRIDTRTDDGMPLPIERGAEFLHGFAPESWDLVKAAGGTVFEASQANWFRHGRGLRRRDGMWNDVDRVMQRTLKYDGDDCSFVEFLKRDEKKWRPSVERAALMYVAGFNAADPRQISVHSLRAAELESNTIEGDRSFRIAEGYAIVVEELARRFKAAGGRIVLNCAATVVRHQPRRVEVETISSDQGSRTFRAAQLVCTLPLGVLQARGGARGAIRWEPDLPEKRAALAKLHMGEVVKLVLDFAEPFWESQGYDEFGFCHSPDEVFPTWWTTQPVRTARLTGWSGGPKAARLAKLSDRAILRRGLAVVGRLFRNAPKRLASLIVRSEVCNWQRDPWARGAYGWVKAGGVAAVQEYAAPVDGTLFFAGEATHAEFNGTVAGAIASGYRAAREIQSAERTRVGKRRG
jgi:monoamine oxidase